MHAAGEADRLLDMASIRERVVSLLTALPEVEIEVGGERNQHRGATVRKKRFAWYLDNHHGDSIVALTCKAPEGVNTAMVNEDPVRYFEPSYTGPKGWVGMRLDVDGVDWDRIELSLQEAYRMTAPKSLIRQLDTD